jgi:hypothetical protein
MARIRSVHPTQWTDDEFLSCTPLARLLAIGIRNEADDGGVFEWKPLTLKRRLLPIDNCDVVLLLEELEAANIVRRYEVGGRHFGAIRNFGRFQSPRKPNLSYPRAAWVDPYVGSRAVPADDEGEPVHTLEPAEGRPGTPPSPSQTGRSTEPEPLEGGSVPQNAGTARQREKESERELESERRIPPTAGAAAPASVEAAIYRRGKELLGSTAGGLLTDAIKSIGLGGLSEILGALERTRPDEPVPWFRRAVAARVKPPPNGPSGDPTRFARAEAKRVLASQGLRDGDDGYGLKLAELIREIMDGCNAAPPAAA